MLELTVLTVPDCPNGPALLEPLAEALAEHPGTRLGRLAPTDGGLRAVQQRVLRSFAGSGAPLVISYAPDSDLPTTLDCRIGFDKLRLSYGRGERPGADRRGARADPRR